MTIRLAREERETIINFNEGEPLANIFTYSQAWQRHLEKRLGLKPVMDNGCGGKEYEIDKKRIKPPRAPLKLSAERRAKLTSLLRQKSVFRPKNKDSTVKSDTLT